MKGQSNEGEGGGWIKGVGGVRGQTWVERRGVDRLGWTDWGDRPGVDRPGVDRLGWTDLWLTYWGGQKWCGGKEGSVEDITGTQQ